MIRGVRELNEYHSSYGVGPDHLVLSIELHLPYDLELSDSVDHSRVHVFSIDILLLICTSTSTRVSRAQARLRQRVGIEMTKSQKASPAHTDSFDVHKEKNINKRVCVP